MDPLQNITDRAHQLSSLARRAFLEGHPTIAYEHLGYLYDFLDDSVGSCAREKSDDVTDITAKVTKA